jgi:lipoprotein-releasing system permease protein
MSYELSISLRYLKTKRHGLFAVLTTAIAIGSVTLGVAALIVTLSVMNGFRADIQEKTLGISPHIILFGTEKETAVSLKILKSRVESAAGVESSAPFVSGQTLVKSPKAAQGIVLRGILPEEEFKVTGVKKTLIAGDWSDLEDKNAAQKIVILGRELAHNLGVSLGGGLLIFSPSESASLGGMGSIPKVESYKVGGIFQSGFYEYDSNLAMVSLENARRLLSLQGVTALGIKTRDLSRAEKISEAVAYAAGTPYWARSWQSMNRNLFQALKLEKIVMTLILTLIILVASFTIISNLILMSIEKTRDIGILRALGASRSSIRKIFFMAGTILGTTGIAAGAMLGILISEILKRTQLIRLPQDVYYVDRLPILIQWTDVAWVVLGALLITSISSLYPARQASAVNPVEAIRYG